MPRNIENEVLELATTSGELDGTHHGYTCATVLLDNALGLLDCERIEIEQGRKHGIEREIPMPERLEILALMEKCQEFVALCELLFI